MKKSLLLLLDLLAPVGLFKPHFRGGPTWGTGLSGSAVVVVDDVVDQELL